MFMPPAGRIPFNQMQDGNNNPSMLRDSNVAQPVPTMSSTQDQPHLEPTSNLPAPSKEKQAQPPSKSDQK